MKWLIGSSHWHLKVIATLIFIIINTGNRQHGVAANRNMFNVGVEQFTGADVSIDVFGDDNMEVFPVAYFDVNSDKLTDLVAVSRERTSINVFLAMSKSPFLRRAYHSDDITIRFSENKRIISVRPGDFTGNGMADLMVTLGEDEYTLDAYEGGTNVDILFCTIHLDKQEYQNMDLECGGTGSGGVIRNLSQEPTVLDLNGDMVLDLLGEKWIDADPSRNRTRRKQRMIWLSEKTTDSFEWKVDVFNVVGPNFNETLRDMTNVSSNAYADVDGNSIPELLILTEDPTVPREKAVYYLETYEISKDNQERISFRFKNPPEWIKISPENQTKVLGQPMMVDFEHNGKIVHLLPYCTDFDCSNNVGIYAIDQGNALPLPLGSLTYEGKKWSFMHPPIPPTSTHPNNRTNLNFKMEKFYSRALGLRVGDYNLDGYPDLLGVLKMNGKLDDKRITRAVLFENVPCVPAPESPCHYNRTFNANFDIFKNYNDVISASFYDISDNGALDVILVTQHQYEEAPQNQRFVIKAFENNMNFDSSFLKVMVLTGQECFQCEGDIPYGNVLPGATIKYSSLNTKGVEECGVTIQTYRTSHMPLDLPCNVFGIGHSPNFIETLSVEIAPNGKELYKKEWKQIIPNSQIVVVPNPLERPNRWTMKLFLTPSDVVLKTFGILVGVCLVLATIVSGLEFKERWEDRLVRQREAHRLVLWLS